MKSILLVSALLGLASPAFAQAAVPNPLVSGPVTGGVRGTALMASFFDLGVYGYVEQEFTVEGTATAYTQTPQLTAPYRTRVIVRRPLDPQRFNGTVYVEWLNVTGGVSLDPDWAVGQRELLRSGYAYVGVDAQAAGVAALKAWDPVRYATLVHPSDDFSFSIYAQVAQAIDAPSGIDLLGGLPVQRVLATGESQSGTRLNDYVNGVHPQIVDPFDGFMIGGNDGQITDLAHLDVPVLRFNSDFDVGGDAQPDGPFYRVWEMGGSGHNTYYYSSYASAVTTRDLGGAFAENDHPPVCLVNRYPKQLVFRSVLHHLNQWVAQGIAPPNAPHTSFTAGVRDVDSHGNSVGGIRLPAVEVPVATYNPGPACGATSGSTQYFDAATLAALYPTQADYDAGVLAAQDAAVAAGFILPADRVQCPAQFLAPLGSDIVISALDDCDGDTVAEAVDNCLFTPNPGQADSGGVASAVADGIGDACQCGDVTGNGIVNGQDANAIRRHALGLTPNPLFAVPGNCDVTGNGTCNGQDANAVKRAALGQTSPQFGQRCHNALGKPVPPGL
jgi:hypothetical protein